MSTLVEGHIQAFPMPLAGSTTEIALLAVAKSSVGVPDSGMYRISSDGAVHVAKDSIAAIPSATVNDMPLAANQPEYFGLEKGATVSAIGVSGSTVSLTLMP